MSNQLDKILKKSFEDAKKKPSDKVWAQIEKELLYKKQKKKVFWMRITAGIALLFGLSSFLYNSFQNTTQLASNVADTQDVKELLVDADDNSENTKTLNENDAIELNNTESTLVSNTETQQPIMATPGNESSLSKTVDYNSDRSSGLAFRNKSNGRNQDNNGSEALLANNNSSDRKRNETTITLAARFKKLPSKTNRNITRSPENYYNNNIIASTDKATEKGEKTYVFTGDESNSSQWALGGFYAADSPEEYELQNTGTALSSVNGEASFQSTRSFSRGITVAYKINDKFEVNTGITMANRSGFSEGNSNFYASTEITTGIGTTDNEGFNSGQYSDTDLLADLVTDKNIENTNTIDYQFLEIPLTIQYNFYEGSKIKSFVNTGMSAQITSEYTVTNNDGIVLENESDMPTQMNALIGAGFEYKVHKNLGFRLNPMMRLYLGERDFNSGDRYYMSFNTGLNYNF